MNAKILVTGLLTCFVMTTAHAETILLKSGIEVTGQVIEKNSQKIKMQVNGVPMTYYVDEIRNVDGVDAAAFISAPTTVTAPPVAAPVPAAAAVTAKSASPAVPKSSKKELILQFIDVFGTRSGLTENFEALLKAAPPEQAVEIKKALNVDEIINDLVPVYDKYFTEQELEAYIEFYASPAGKKLVETMPKVMTDSVGVSLKYFKVRLPNLMAKEKK